MLEFVVFVLTLALLALVYAYLRLRADVARVAGSTAKIRLTLDEMQNENSNLKAQLAAKDSEIEANAATIEAEQAKVRAGEERIAAMQAEHAETTNTLSYRNNLMTTLAHAAYDILLVVNQSYCIVASNKASQQVFGFSPENGVRMADVTGTNMLNQIVENALINVTDSFEEQVSINQRTYRIRVQVIRHESDVHVALALQDITQLIRLNRARRDMVANISHELRTPIANIRLIIDGLFHDQDKPKRKDSISSLRAIARETDALLWLVQEMADLSMIESGQAIVRMVEVSMNEIVTEAIERLTDQSGFKQIELVKNISDDLHVLCDRDLIQRVVVNLLHNALKWSPEGAAITITALSNGDETTLTFEDKGPGVPANQVDRIFERFYQVDASRSGNEGTGLGLAICRHIVEAHGGRIWAEPNTNKPGGCFRFTLLSAESAEEAEIVLPAETE